MRFPVRRSTFLLPLLLFVASRVDAQQPVAFRKGDVLSVEVDSEGPQAIALVDVNKNNKPILVAVSEFNQFVNVFLNDGNGNFAGAEPTQYRVRAGPLAVASGDFDQDGLIDLVTVNDDDSISVLYSDSPGSFNAVRFDFDLSASNFDLAAAVAVDDLNNDRLPDLAVIGDGSVYLLKSNGSDRSFSPLGATVISTRSVGGFAITTGLLDNNNFPDLVISNTDGSVAYFLSARGDGTFLGARLLSSGSSPAGIVVGEWDSDPNNDIAVVDSENFGTDNVTLWFGDGAGNFTDPPSVTTAELSPYGIAKADFNNDGRIDLVVTNGTDQPALSFLVNAPDDPDAQSGFRLEEPANLLGIAQLAVQAADLNADGKPDVVAVDDDTQNIHVYINTTGQATTPTTPAGTATPTPGPGTPTATSPPPTSTPTPTRTITPTPTPIPIPYGVCNTNQAGQPTVGGQPVAVAVGLFKNLSPRRQFIAVADKTGNRIVILTAQITSGAADPCAVLGLQRGVDVSNVTAPVAVVAQDLDGDSNDDLAIVGSTGLSIFYGDGSGAFTPGAGNPLTAGTGPHMPAIADFNRDGRPDVIVANDMSNDTSIFLNAGQRNFAPACPISVGRRAGLVIAQDLNLDGRPDFAVASAQTNDISVFLQGTPTPTPGTPAPTPSPGGLPLCSTFASNFHGLTPINLTGTPQALLVDSFDLTDAIPDLAVALSMVGSNGSLVVFLGRATSGSDVSYQRQNPVSVLAPSGAVQTSLPSALGAGDITRDGRTDLVVTDRNNNDVALFFANSNGSFGSALLEPVGGRSPVGMTMKDIDGDGRPDAVIANQDDGSVSILITSKPPATPTPPPTPTVTITPTASATNTPPPTPSATATATQTPTATATRTRAPTTTPTLTGTPTIKPGTIGLNGSCAVDPGRRPDASTLALSVAALAFAWYRRRHCRVTPPTRMK